MRQVYWLIVSAAWGTVRLTQAKLSVKVDDNEWGFGQILPVFLLVGPIVTAFEAFPSRRTPGEGGDESSQDSGGASETVVLVHGSCYSTPWHLT